MPALRTTLSILVAFVLLPAIATAVTCPSCNNGRRIHSETCECGCTGAYLPPTCTFTAADPSVRMIFYLALPTFNYSIDLLNDAVAYAVDNSKTAATLPLTFVRAGDSFQTYSYVVVGVPGYGVARVLDAVSHRDPWVDQYRILSAHMFGSDGSGDDGSSGLFDLDRVVYAQGNIIITISGVMWLVAVLVLVIVLVCVENCLTKNTEEYIMESGGSLKRARSKDYQLAGGSPKKAGGPKKKKKGDSFRQ